MSNPDHQLLKDIQESIIDMQSKKSNAYQNIKITGKSQDGSVWVVMTASYEFIDFGFEERAFRGGVKEFQWRVREAWKNLMEQIKQTTQSQTIELLQNMQIPDDIKRLSV